MRGNLYAMVTTSASAAYTDLAIDSFFKTAVLSGHDQFVLIDNDAQGIYNSAYTLVNERPLTFAENCNQIIDLADSRPVIMLNNDMVFTSSWNLPLLQYSDAIVLPCCNQTHTYSLDGLELTSCMTMDQFGQAHHALDKVVRLHRNTVGLIRFERLLMGFYAFVLPPRVYEQIGYFDVNFGIGGGEDVDYRLRAIAQSIPVKYVSHSYVLHFGGKSTWDGAETAQQTHSRDQQYWHYFETKWSRDLAHLCLSNGNAAAIIEQYGLESLIKQGNYSQAIATVMKSTMRTK